MAKNKIQAFSQSAITGFVHVTSGEGFGEHGDHTQLGTDIADRGTGYQKKRIW